jgi:hypothetical protein
MQIISLKEYFITLYVSISTMGNKLHFNQYFSNIRMVSIIVQGNFSISKKPQTFHKLQTNFNT